MAKKKTKKKEPQYNPQTMIKSLQDQVWDLYKRIDRIVDAISKSKRVKGL